MNTENTENAENVSVADAECDSCTDGSTDSLDEEFMEDKEVQNMSQTLNALENPTEIEDKVPMDKEGLQKFYENLRKMPKDQLLRTLGSLSNIGDKHEFRTLDDNRRKKDSLSLREKLHAKLSVLRMGRASKQTREAYVDTVLKKENDKKDKEDATLEKMLSDVNAAAADGGSKKKRRKHRKAKKSATAEVTTDASANTSQ